MRSLPILIIALTIAVFVPNVCAENVTYPQEYYDSIARADSITERLHDNNDNWYLMSYSDPFNALNYRLVVIQITLEKQNELIGEQNELLKKLLNQTYTTDFNGTSNGWPIYTIKPNL
jgi:hypothetical protein